MGWKKEKKGMKEKLRSFYLNPVNSYFSFKTQLRYQLLQEAFPDLPAGLERCLSTTIMFHT